MKPKKTPKANLENKRGIFLQIGLLISLGLALLAFEWKSSAGPERITGVSLEEWVFEENVVITREEKIQPREIPKPADIIIIVDQPDPGKVEFTGLDVVVEPGDELIYLPPPEPEVEDPYLPFQVMEKPGFNGGGTEEFRIWVMKNIVYPQIAIDYGVGGTVYVQFTVNSRGKVQDVVVLRGVDPELDREAVRVVSSSPAWTPGKIGVRDVSVVFTMPISFVLR